MNSLWSHKSKYTTLDPAFHSIAKVFISFYEFLPYERNYSSLNNEELLEIIITAKENHWQALDLSSCGLKELPDELWELTDLRMLSIGNKKQHAGDSEEKNDNSFTIVPRKIEKLVNLQALSLSGLCCQIDKRTPLELPNLRYLDIYNCGFPQIPDALLIPSIEKIGFNCLEDYLSSNITLLPNLSTAYFKHSKFKSLPDNIDHLEKLQYLILDYSDITSLPSSMMNMSNLTYLSFGDTPLAHSIPPEILKQSAQDLIRYIILNKQSNAKKEYFNESKMIIVGHGHVGKTSLLERLTRNSYTTNSESTEGINIKKLEYKHNGQNIRLNIWDFGGQEIYHSTHQFFLTKRSLYLYVWDALAEPEHGKIDYWLKTIQSLADDSPIILVVNKCDKDLGNIEKLDITEYKSKYPQIQDIIYVSCKDNIGIEELKKLIKQTAQNMPLMHVKWPSTWMNVRRTIEETTKKHEKEIITYSDYLHICQSNGITDEREALSLIKNLHDLGIVLYYHEDPLLKNLVILSPEWGTNAVYRILDEQERRLKGRNGVVFIDDLPFIWDDKGKYPYEYYPYLLNLMEKFQLAFKINPSTYLMADLLDNKPIDLGWEFNKLDTLSFRYEYDFLPTGLMTRFIVSANRLLVSKNGVKQCWRKGAYLIYNSAKALVRLFDDLSECYIQIDIIGDNPRDKRVFLSVIRWELDEINNKYNKIKITKKIPCCCSDDCSFLYNYDRLLEAKDKGLSTVQCHLSWEEVPLSRLLDGVYNIDKTDDYINDFQTSSQVQQTPASVFVPIEVPEHTTPSSPTSSVTSKTPTSNPPSSNPPSSNPAPHQFLDLTASDINAQLIKWAYSSPLYRTIVGQRDPKETNDWLEKALQGNESDWVRYSFELMKEIWRNNPEWGLMPDYQLLSGFEHAGKYYIKYRDHLAHMFKVLLLGLCLYENTPIISSAFDRMNISPQEFSVIWSIAALYHDIGYVLDTQDINVDENTIHTVCDEFVKILRCPFNNLYGDYSFSIADEEDIQAKYGCNTINSLLIAQIEDHLDDFKRYGSSIGLCVNDTGNYNPIKTYYEMVSRLHGSRIYYDHGISSALILLYMQKKLKCYVTNVHDSINDPAKREQYPIQAELISEIDKVYSALNNMTAYSEKAAKALALHNITKKHSLGFIKNLRYKNVTIEHFKISLANEPFSYLLRVCDEFQCWDRPYMATPIVTGDYLKGQKVLIKEKDNHPALSIDDVNERQKIKDALNNIIDPPIDTWMDPN